MSKLETSTRSTERSGPRESSKPDYFSKRQIVPRLKTSIVLVNLSSRSDRRAAVFQQLSAKRISVIRQPGVNSKWVGDTRGFQNKRRYACSLAKRMVIRKGFQSDADAVLVLEDDAIFHPEFEERLEAIELPDDWGLFYLGCRHIQEPIPWRPGLVKCTQATDNQAFLVRRDYMHKVIRGLSGKGKGSPKEIMYSDEKLSLLQGEIPSYAAYPNLAWQAYNFSDGYGAHICNYLEGGKQNIQLEMMAEVDAEIAENGWSGKLISFPTMKSQISQNQPPSEPLKPLAPAPQTSDSRPGSDTPPPLSFLNGAPARHTLEQLFPARFHINLGRIGDRRNDVVGQFQRQGLPVERFPAFDGRHVRNKRGHGTANAYACRLSHRSIIRNARLNKASAVLIFEDDVVLPTDFRTVAEALKPPEDWGVIFFGCTHVETPEVVAPGWVKVKKIWSLHAYAVRDIYYDTVLKALNAKGEPGREEGADIVLSRLADQIPMYAVYPNIA